MFLEMELPYSNIKKFLYFFKRKLSKLSYIFLYFRKWNPALPNLKRKNKKNSPRKILYISGNRTFLL